MVTDERPADQAIQVAKLTGRASADALLGTGQLCRGCFGRRTQLDAVLQPLTEQAEVQTVWCVGTGPPLSGGAAVPASEGRGAVEQPPIVASRVARESSARFSTARANVVRGWFTATPAPRRAGEVPLLRSPMSSLRHLAYRSTFRTARPAAVYSRIPTCGRGGIGGTRGTTQARDVTRLALYAAHALSPTRTCASLAHAPPPVES